ncbi:hypothetical protein DM02DRAFT_309966 [Periconia macrospinosa]|uniref:Ig-like domain-containing protein n=1 Tax=Periconia macrospinosa TaxID=97972 RepID=A0A2V1D1K5_9PLEO|nr:hypothetical protein DM02DRAFT_309966 [Periconia macrospinosa]
MRSSHAQLIVSTVFFGALPCHAMRPVERWRGGFPLTCQIHIEPPRTTVASFMQPSTGVRRVDARSRRRLKTNNISRTGKKMPSFITLYSCPILDNPSESNTYPRWPSALPTSE